MAKLKPVAPFGSSPYAGQDFRTLNPNQLQEVVGFYDTHSLPGRGASGQQAADFQRDLAAGYFLLQTDPVLQTALASGNRAEAEKYLQQQLGSDRWRLDANGKLSTSSMPSTEWWIAAGAIGTVGVLSGFGVIGGAAGASGAGGSGGAGGAAGAAGAAATGGGTLSLIGNILKWGLPIAGAAIDILGQKKAAEHNEEIAAFNALAAEQRAADALARGQEEEQRLRMGVRALIGSQRAGFAGQNVDVGIGSPVDVVADSSFLGELDALTIRTNAAREAWGYQVDAENIRRGGEAQSSAANWGIANTIIGTGASLVAARYGWGRA